MAKAKDLAAGGSTEAPSEEPTTEASTEEPKKSSKAKGSGLKALQDMRHTDADGNEETLMAGEEAPAGSIFLDMHPGMFERA